MLDLGGDWREVRAEAVVSALRGPPTSGAVAALVGGLGADVLR
jgi:hypothetical protein